MQLGRARRQLVNSIVIQRMRKAQIQMDLLTEDGDPIGTLQYALARERGQENQQKMANPNKPITEINPIGSTEVHYIRRNKIQQITSIQQRTGIIPTPKTGPIPDCWKFGYNSFQASSATAQQKTNYVEYAKR